MDWSAHRDIAVADRDPLCAQLDRRPAGWLRPFLVLAAQTGADDHHRPWFRLGAAEDHRARLRWHPGGPEALFESFDGWLSLAPISGGCRLELAGRWDGGDAERADRALTTLLDLLAAGLTELGGDPDGLAPQRTARGEPHPG